MTQTVSVLIIFIAVMLSAAMVAKVLIGEVNEKVEQVEEIISTLNIDNYDELISANITLINISNGEII